MVGTTIPHYKVIEKLAQGGMGEVYHVGVASAPAVDLSEQWHEWYMGLPQENTEEYEYASNLR